VSKRLETCPNNLPIQLSSFIGRERAIAELKSLLSTTRLLTLTGAGGSGKTRLALQVATNLLAEFEHGVWWVELDALTDPTLVPQQVASTLGLAEQPGRQLMDTLSDALQPKKLLLVLDNCEHLIATCARLVETLLRSCADLRILTTSREAFTIPGETVWPVPSLGVPDAYHLPPREGLVKYEAVQLFIERAMSVLPTFRLTQENASALAQVCRRLDGIPLAIELAAARVKVLSVEQIAARLDDSYRLLAGGSRTALPRQQTLQATIDWSHHLLSEKERILFRRLSVFMGGFTLEAAEAICAGNGIEQDEVLDLLSHLVDKSLVAVAERGGEARYRLLETIRQYGQDKLQEFGEAANLRRNHRDWYVGLAERAEVQDILGTRLGSWFDRLEVEHDNLRAALGWSLEQQEAETAARMGAAIWRFWLLRGYMSEGRRWLERALAGFSERTAVRAKALHAAGVLASYQDDYQRAKPLVEESLEVWRVLGDRQGSAYALHSLGLLAQNGGNYEGAVSFFEESLQLSRELENYHGMTLTLAGLGLTVLYLGDDERASVLCEESLALSRERGDLRGIASALTNLGMTVLERGDDERARTLCEESFAMRQKLGDKGGSAHTLAILGRIALHQSAYERATTCFEESLTLRQETGEKEGIATALEGLAAVAGVGGQPISAARLYGSAESLRDTLDAPLTPTDRSYYEQTVAAVRAQLDEATFQRAWAEGRAMTLEQAIAAAKQVKAPEHITPASVRTPVGTSSTSPSRGNPFGLTAREIEVLRLVTQGLTYAQIAEQLIISPRTADAHLRSIYGKLGVTSRSAATRCAIEHKLV
jgi:predicted ATPase/DNA-binding CsgD family transcriptional regulator